MEEHAPPRTSGPGSEQQHGHEITRKITACAACRKQKIKCFMDDGPPCSRCRKRGLSCTLNKSLQTLLESDIDWKARAETRIQDLEASLEKVHAHPALRENLDNSISGAGDSSEDVVGNAGLDAIVADKIPATVLASDQPPLGHEEQQPSHDFEVILDRTSGPATIPGSVVPEVRTRAHVEVQPDQDLVSKGLVSIDEAEAFLALYQNRLDHFLYCILGDRRELVQLRQASPLLLTAICTVGALHSVSQSFDQCYQEFTSQAARHTFSRRSTPDDVRALCIAAFWLSGVSWNCAGLAVRIATELQLHRSVYKALEGSREHYQRTRLYYLVYVCDHHFSVPYGRPPMTREDETIRQSSAFLETPLAVEDDARLISQVQFWSVGAEIYDTFGVDIDRPLSLTMIAPLRRLTIKLDQIRADWTERFARNQYVGNYPRKGVGLHYHFAKLYLTSMAFRGIGQGDFRAAEVALDIDEIMSSALSSATAILRAVVHDPEIQEYLNGLPTYFDVMLAFAVVFLLKVSTQYSSIVRVDSVEVRSLVLELIRKLKLVTSNMHPRHLLVSVATGTDVLFQQCFNGALANDLSANTDGASTQVDKGHDGQHGLDHWDNNSLNDLFMGDFDFLAAQNLAWTPQAF